MTMPNDPEQSERPEVYAFPHMEMDPETFGPKRFLRSDLLGMPNQDPFKYQRQIGLDPFEPAPAEYTAKQPVEARLLDDLLERLARRREQLDRHLRYAGGPPFSNFRDQVEGQRQENDRVVKMVKKMKETLQ